MDFIYYFEEFMERVSDMDINVSSLSKTFISPSEKRQILNDISFSIVQGEWVNVIGPSGSGKTTLLECVAGLIFPDAGATVNIGGIAVHDVTDPERREFRRRNIGFVYQDYRLFPAYTALQNVMLPEWPYKKESELRIRANELLRELQLETRINAVPTALSGGEKQRVAIARALLNNPRILICDEPTGNLDQSSRHHILSLLKKIQLEGRTILFVTHDYAVLPYGDRVLQLKEGKLEEIEKHTLSQ